MTDSWWYNRDLPVLQAIVDLVDEHGHADVRGLQVGELDQRDIKRAVRALAQAGTFFSRIEGSLANPFELVLGVTEHAQQMAGRWPTPAEALADQLLQAIQTAAETAKDEESRSKLKAAAAALGGMGRDLLVQVAATAFTRGIGW